MTGNEKPHIGFIGVGGMGRPMASNLLKAGYSFAVYDVNPAPVAALVAQGANSAESGRAVAAACDLVITMIESALKILVKDLGFVMDTANAMGHPLLLGGVAHQLYKMAHAMEWDNLDDSILIRLMETIAGKL
ncbi:MAG TPA: NAD(P)-binding domain-containing protein [Ktedonosporobacter sp.]|nr:NAD(P)-binding domain-containing protein [Ktedonosporobacter sp.]